MRLLPIAMIVILSVSGINVVAEGAESITSQLKRLKAVGSEGAGNAEAASAWKDLVGLGGEALIPTIAAMDDANPIQANWLRLAAQAIVENEKRANRALPADQIEAFAKDTKHAPISRRLAYEFLTEADPKAPERLLPGMIQDPSVEIRRDAIAAAIMTATPLIKSDAKKAAAEFEHLFHASRDQDQTEALAKTLKDLGITTDLNRHFGVVSDWMLMGPFDSTMGAGYDKPYDPEMKVDLASKCKGKAGAEVKWVSHTSAEPYGAVDFNKAIGKHKDAAAYAFTTIETDKELPVEIRFGCITAIKVFLNGKEIYAREEYHHGQRFDQYKGLGTLKPGPNELLVKVCQNNQTENWAQDWKFQLRVCDVTGGAVPIKVVKNKQPTTGENSR